MTENKKIRMATIWLDGCSGCHMSFLDMDERLIEIAQKVELVYSPYVDTKEFPENVDVTLMEGAIGSDHDLELLHKIRKNTKTLIAFGDCAVTGNVTAMRNTFTVESIFQRAYVETVDTPPKMPAAPVPTLLPKAKPLHEYVPVDFFIQGCPPNADLIYYILTELLAGRKPGTEVPMRFG